MVRSVDARRVWAEIDLDALAHNLELIKGRAGPRVSVMLVVKADAYGHGAVAVAHHALRAGIAMLGVGTSAEALELRAAGILTPILVLGTIVDDEAALALRNDVHIALHSSDRCQMLHALAKGLGRRAKVHLKIDTGLGRLGVLPGRALELLEQIRRSDHLELAGIMTHIGSGFGALDPTASQQLAVFEDLLAAARKAGLLGGALVHAANSACIFTGLGPAYDLVRPGIGAYGVLPGRLAPEAGLRPVMALRTQVVFLKDVPGGAPIGYEGTWRAPHRTRIATLPVGYNDGLSFRLSNRGEALVRGQRAPIVGRISMDYTTLDVGHIPGVAVGDPVTLIGRQGAESIGLEEVAERAGTIAYEIACSLGKRVERVYRGGDVVLTPKPPPPAARRAAAPSRAF
jgi:alanine racemase